MQILYARDRKPLPWKNGGGTTSEVAAYPPGASMNDFGWRISIAKVEQGGPFSVFPHIDRVIALFEGRMSLAIAGFGDVELSPRSEPFAFPGDAVTSATLIEGPVTDLNVMVRRGAFTARMTRVHLTGEIECGEGTFLFPLAKTTAHTGAYEYAALPYDALAGAGRVRFVGADVIRIDIVAA